MVVSIVSNAAVVEGNHFFTPCELGCLTPIGRPMPQGHASLNTSEDLAQVRDAERKWPARKLQKP
jgi:hypothetical protein